MTSDHASHRAAVARPRRLGLLAHGFASWGGGLDFLRGIATGLHHADATLELHVLAPMRGPLVMARNLRDAANGLLGRPNMAAHRPQPAHLERALAGTGAILHMIDIGPRALARATARLRLDALLPAIAPQPADGTPWVGYVFDFQHKHLPQFFTGEERVKRDVEFGRMLDNATAVIVNARDVVKDIEQYYPRRRAKVFAMPFSPAPGGDAFSVDVADARRRHGVGGRYFIVCNQFWKHKDHGTAFKAFAALSARHPELQLVCTGATSDHRFPGHFDELMRQADRDGVADRILALGLIPKLDQLALLRGAVALVQPTLFEGGPGGGAVFDAVAVGQRSIVSDIPVNTEIDEPGVTFFEAGNAASLAAHMEAALAHEAPAAPDPAELIARGIERRRACGQVLLQAVDFVRAA
ncbi:glycosyltransferase [Roseateles chitinivorans]|uniref:glycosyltransferase n=1 Tax=Roseateles chitinivorans TaxID=2917965 RepID=UPI003D665F48